MDDTVSQRKRTYDALLQVLVEAVVADLLQQQGMELLERFEVLEVSVDHVQVFAGAICRPALYKPHVCLFLLCYCNWLRLSTYY